MFLYTENIFEIYFWRNMTPSKIRRSDHAYEALKELIIQLKLSPGSPINEDEMMERLNVGRTPFREACQRLSQEDLVRSIPRRGYFVSNIAVNDPLHVFEVRQQLEAFSARLAAERITPEQLANLEHFVDSLPGDRQRTSAGTSADRTIHRLVAEAETRICRTSWTGCSM
jgi:DNA-binding GntR family transcriptional regulator